MEQTKYREAKDEKISEAEKKNLENRELNEKIIKNTIEIQELSKENEKVLNEKKASHVRN